LGVSTEWQVRGCTWVLAQLIVFPTLAGETLFF
jgi:hypothetical protein